VQATSRCTDNGDSRLVVHIPIQVVSGVDHDRTAFAAQDLRPVRRRPGGAGCARCPFTPRPAIIV